jgi:prepilin-type N-terminal cleavage/methylation domain-containing protein
MNREMGGKVASGDSSVARAGAGRRSAARGPGRGGFTLVELLVVMGIIALLVSLLFPAVTGVMVAVRRAATANVINTLGVALDAFRIDWGVYPPSDNKHDDILTGATGSDVAYGFYNLFLALTGPTQKGWGTNYNSKSPFGGSATKAYPPYFLPDKVADMGWTDSAGTYHPYDCFADAFRPGRPIFYFRYEPGDTNQYSWDDNPISQDTAPLWGFASQAHFEMLVRPRDPSGTPRWVRDDYLLISCGGSRYWGYVKQTTDAGGNVTITPALETDIGVATCDNVTNFSYSR